MALAQAHGLRAYDAVQLAAVLHATEQRTARGSVPLVLVSSDNELNDAARAEGLAVDDPNDHP